jgi:xylan 1,4-beta-xylosidase
MFSQMSGQQLPVTSDAAVSLSEMMKSGVRGQPDVSAQASLDKNKIAVIVWHYHDDDVPGPAAAVSVELSGIPFADGKAKLTHYRIDADHSNSYEVWKRMGSPYPISEEQFATLEKAGQLATLGEPQTVAVKAGQAEVKFNLPRQGVSLLVLEGN